MALLALTTGAVSPLACKQHSTPHNHNLLVSKCQVTFRPQAREPSDGATIRGTHQ